MKYTLVILASAFVFAVLGLITAWAALEYYTSSAPLKSGDDMPFLTFIGLGIGGLISGLVVGVVAALLGHFLTRRTADSPVRK
jgi:hypothetical protein